MRRALGETPCGPPRVSGKVNAGSNSSTGTGAFSVRGSGQRVVSTRSGIVTAYLTVPRPRLPA